MRDKDIHHTQVDVAGILASLPEEFNDPGDDPWGGANLDTGVEFDADR